MKGALVVTSWYMMGWARPAIFAIAALLPMTLGADEARTQWPPQFDA